MSDAQVHFHRLVAEGLVNSVDAIGYQRIDATSGEYHAPGFIDFNNKERPA